MSHRRFKFNLSYPLTLVGSAVALFLGFMAVGDYYRYIRLSVTTEARIEKLKVIKKSSSSYPIKAKYTFEFKEKNYNGSTLLPPPYHLNRLSAQKSTLQLANKKWSVWLDPKYPFVSSLSREFPIKRILYFLTALGVTLYFWFVETSSKTRQPAK